MPNVVAFTRFVSMICDATNRIVELSADVGNTVDNVICSMTCPVISMASHMTWFRRKSSEG